MELFPIDGKEQAVNLSTKQLKEERTFIEFIVESVASHGLYYSETYDLTHTLQRQSAMADEKQLSEPLWKRAGTFTTHSATLCPPSSASRLLCVECGVVWCGVVGVTLSLRRSILLESCSVERFCVG